MNRKLLIGISGGALALVLAGGAAYAGPALHAGTAAAVATDPTPAPGRPAGQGQAARGAKAQALVRSLIKATADATSSKPKDVLAALGDGQSLAQYASAHGSSDTAVVAAGRARLDARLKQAVANGRIGQARADELLKQYDAAAPKVVADTNLGVQIGRAWMRKHSGVAALIGATAAVTGTNAKEVRAALQQGQSLAQYAQAHGKTADDILAKLRAAGEARLQQRLDQAKKLIEQPGLGGTQPPAAQP